MKKTVTTFDVAAAMHEATHLRAFTSVSRFNEDVAFILNRRLAERTAKRREAVGLCFELTGIFILLCGVMVAVSIEDWLGWGCLAAVIGVAIGAAGQRYGAAR
jgi:Flp pilus assembly protein TadB